MRCPWCRETVPLLTSAPECPKCGKPLRDESGERVRPLDLDYDKVAADADLRSSAWIRRGVVWALVCAAFALVPPVLPFAYLLLVAGQFAFARFFVARHYARHFAPARRLVTRWIGRLALVLIVVPVHAAALPVPGLPLVVAPLVYWGTLSALRAYMRFHLGRERERQGILGVEKVVLVLLALAVLCGACAVGAAVAAGLSILSWFGY